MRFHRFLILEKSEAYILYENGEVLFFWSTSKLQYRSTNTLSNQAVKQTISQSNKETDKRTEKKERQTDRQTD